MERLRRTLPGVPDGRRAFLGTAGLLTTASLLATLASCAPGRNLASLPPATDANFLLGPGDQVRVITFGEQTLTGEFRISDGGTIAIPLLGPVQANGLSTRQLEVKIATELKSKNLFRDPSVSVEVIAYRPIFVLGEVNKPGQYPYQPGMTLLTAVAIAGGFTYRAWEDYASVVRSTGKSVAEGRVSRQALLQPGDVVTVFERTF